MALSSSIINFASAECFGGKGATLDVVFCADTIKTSNGEEYTLITECSRGTNGNYECHPLRGGNVGDTSNPIKDSQIPLGLRNALDSAIKKSQNSDLAIGESSTQGTNSSQSSTINNPPKTQSPQQTQPSLSK